MEKDKPILVIGADTGTCLSSILVISLFAVIALSWTQVVEYIIGGQPGNLEEVPARQWIVLVGVVGGFLLHIRTQWMFHRFFGGRPRWRKRWYSEKERFLDRRMRSLLFPLAIPTWSPKKRYSVRRYLVILLSPILPAFLLLPLLMRFLQSPAVYLLMFAIGWTMAFQISRDLLGAGMLIAASRPEDFDVVDRENGTYIILRQPQWSNES